MTEIYPDDSLPFDQHFQTGELVQVSTRNHSNSWIPGEVQLSSANGRSLAVQLEKPLGGLRDGFAINMDNGNVIALFSYDGPDEWRDVYPSHFHQIRRPPE